MVQRTGHIEDGGPGSPQIVLSHRTEDQHCGKRHDERRHFHQADEHTVEQAAQAAGHQGEQQCEEHAVRGIEHHHGEAAHQRQHGAHGQVDAAGDDDQAHAEGHDAHHSGVPQDVHHATPGGRAVVDKQIGDEDRQCDEDKAVIIDPGGNALLVQPRFFGLGLQFRVLTHTFTSPSVACITLVAYSMTLSSVISSRGRMVWICPW